jgi:hypothetical protein
MLIVTVTGAIIAVTGYTISNVSIVYWLTAPLSLYGRLLYIIAGITLFSFCMLVALACYYRDHRILLTHHDRSGRRLFCCTLCSCVSTNEPEITDDDRSADHMSGESQAAVAAAAAAVAAATSAPRFSGCLRWQQLSQTEVMCLLGVNNALLSLLVFFATPPTREPPLLGSLLASLSVVAAIPLSKYSLHDRKRYCAVLPLCAVTLIVASTAIALLPTVISGGGLGGAESATDVLAWTLVVAVVQVPVALANVSVQALLLRAGAHLPGEPGRRASAVGVFRFVFYNQLFVGLTTAALFWADLLPWFGSSDSLTQLAEGVRFSFACSLLGPAGALL